jgi:hypothetical protein
MSDSPAAPATTVDAVDEPIPQPPSAAPSVEVSSTEALITTQEVIFSTAAAVGVHRVSELWGEPMRRGLSRRMQGASDAATATNLQSIATRSLPSGS